MLQLGFKRRAAPADLSKPSVVRAARYDSLVGTDNDIRAGPITALISRSASIGSSLCRASPRAANRQLIRCMIGVPVAFGGSHRV
jgi:hypothetical protein